MALPHTDPTDLTGFSFVGGKSHGGWGWSVSECSDLPKAHTDSTDSTKKIFVRFVGFVVWD